MADDEFLELFDISAAELDPIASQVVGRDAHCLGDLSIQKIGASFGTGTVGIFRVAGLAGTSAGDEPWSAVAKVMDDRNEDFRGIDRSPLVELEVYRSGVFAELHGGLRCARCYAIQEHVGLHFLWLEDLTSAPHAPWQPHHYIETARHVGSFNAYWPEKLLPQWQWLGEGGFEKYKSPQLHTLMEQLPSRQHEALINRALPPDVTDKLLEFWDKTEMLFAQNDATTKGVCHLDCHPRNLFPINSTPGQTFTIAVDWPRVGIGHLGFDAGLLLASAVKWLDLSLEQAGSLVEPMLAAYLRGLNDSGWTGNEEQVRLTFLTCLACESLRVTQICFGLADDPDFRKRIAKTVPIEEMLDQWAGIQGFYLMHAGEAIQLANRLQTNTVIS